MPLCARRLLSASGVVWLGERKNGPTSQAEIPSDGVLDFGEFVVFEVVHRAADEAIRVDAADLVDEELGLLSVDLH